MTVLQSLWFLGRALWGIAQDETEQYAARARRFIRFAIVLILTWPIVLVVTALLSWMDAYGSWATQVFVTSLVGLMPLAAGIIFIAWWPLVSVALLVFERGRQLHRLLLAIVGFECAIGVYAALVPLRFGMFLIPLLFLGMAAAITLRIYAGKTDLKQVAGRAGMLLLVLAALITLLVIWSALRDTPASEILSDVGERIRNAHISIPNISLASSQARTPLPICPGAVDRDLTSIEPVPDRIEWKVRSDCYGDRITAPYDWDTFSVNTEKGSRELRVLWEGLGEVRTVGDGGTSDVDTGRYRTFRLSAVGTDLVTVVPITRR